MFEGISAVEHLGGIADVVAVGVGIQGEIGEEKALLVGPFEVA